MEYKLLVVDDEAAVIEILDKVFSERGFQVVTASSGEEALEFVRKKRFDLMVLDMQMTGISGIDVLKALKKDYPLLYVVVLTGHVEYAEQARHIGCAALFTKPVSVGDLVSKIQEILDTEDKIESNMITYGLEYSKAPAGTPMAKILMVDPIPDLMMPVYFHLQNLRACGGLYSVFIIGNKEGALTALSLLESDIVLLNVRAPSTTVVDTAKAILADPHRPKELIYYFPCRDPNQETQLKQLSEKWWRGIPTDRGDIKELGRLIREVALAHGWVKKQDREER